MATGDFTIDDAETVEPVTTNYFRDKAAEFQQIVNALDATGREVDMLIGALPESALLYELVEQKAELDAKKGQIRVVAEAVNLAANGLNQAGIYTPNIKLPATLGAVPLVVAGAGAAAIAFAAALIIWGREWIAGINQRLRNRELLESVPEADRAKVAQAILQTDVALAQADQSPLTSIAGIVKWLAIGAVAFFAYRAFQQFQGGQ